MEEILKIYISENNFVKIRAVLLKINDIILLNPTVVAKPKNEKIKATLVYL